MCVFLGRPLPKEQMKIPYEINYDVTLRGRYCIRQTYKMKHWVFNCLYINKHCQPIFQEDQPFLFIMKCKFSSSLKKNFVSFPWDSSSPPPRLHRLLRWQIHVKAKIAHVAAIIAHVAAQSGIWRGKTLLSGPIMEFSIIFFNPSLMNIFLHSTGDNLACSRAP